jgi:hypothetical protein
MSGLGGGVVDAYLKRRKTALQLDRALLGTFLGAEFGLQALREIPPRNLTRYPQPAGAIG